MPRLVNYNTFVVTTPPLGPAPSSPPEAPLDGAPRRVLEALLHCTEAAQTGGDEGVSLPEIVEQLGGHPNTARHHLGRLIEKGFVHSARLRPQGRGRPGLCYAVTALGRDALLPGAGAASGHYLALAAAFAGRLAQDDDPRAQSRAVGRIWGESLVRTSNAANASNAADGSVAPADAREQVADLLDGLGFAPEPEPDTGVLALTRCPLLDVAREHPEVVCEVHIGLIEAAHVAYGGGQGPIELEAFARPGACILRLP